MAQATNIVLADAQAIPVNHTFAPSGKDKDDTYWYVDRSNTNAIGFWKVSISIKEPGPVQAGAKSTNRTYRVEVGLHEPVLENYTSSIAGAPSVPTVAYIPRSFTQFILPERAIKLDRQNLRKMMASLLSATDVVKVVEDLEYVN